MSRRGTTYNLPNTAILPSCTLTCVCDRGRVLFRSLATPDTISMAMRKPKLIKNARKLARENQDLIFGTVSENLPVAVC